MQTPLPTRPDSHAASPPTALIALHDRTRDAVRGFVVMADNAEPSFQRTVQTFLALHRQQSETLAGLLQAKGEEVYPDGTLMGTVNEMVVKVRAFFDEIDSDTLDQIRSGEDWILQAFDAAIAEETDPATVASLGAMRADLVQLQATT